jgi:hypothetical protein
MSPTTKSRKKDTILGYPLILRPQNIAKNSTTVSPSASILFCPVKKIKIKTCLLGILKITLIVMRNWDFLCDQRDCTVV